MGSWFFDEYVNLCRPIALIPVRFQLPSDSRLTRANTTLFAVCECSTMATTLRLRSALRLPWYVVLLVATYCLLHLGLVVEHPCATQGSNPD